LYSVRAAASNRLSSSSVRKSKCDSLFFRKATASLKAKQDKEIDQAVGTSALIRLGKRLAKTPGLA
jgi:hypothetical protein